MNIIYLNGSNLLNLLKEISYRFAAVNQIPTRDAFLLPQRKKISHGAVSKPYITAKNAEYTQRAQDAICLNINKPIP